MITPPDIGNTQNSELPAQSNSSSVASGITSIIGSGVNYLLQRSLNNQAKRNQMELMDYQINSYPAMVESLKNAGMSQTGAINALSSVASGSMPSASSGGAAPSLDLASALNAGAMLPSQISVNETQATKNAEEAEAQSIANNYLPEKLRLENKNLFIDAMFKHSSIQKNAAEIRNLNEVSKDISLMRPLKLRQFRQDLINSAMQYNVMLSQIRLNNASSENQTSQSVLNNASVGLVGAQSDFLDVQGRNMEQQTYALEFGNMLRRNGFDPNRGFWENLLNQSVTNPRQFRQNLDALNSSVNEVDQRIQGYLGPNYKRNIMLGVGAYIGNRAVQRSLDRRLDRLGKMSNIISNFIPFKSGKNPQVIDLGDDSYFDYNSLF